jgi:hypothetical protein
LIILSLHCSNEDWSISLSKKACQLLNDNISVFFHGTSFGHIILNLGVPGVPYTLLSDGAEESTFYAS